MRIFQATVTKPSSICVIIHTHLSSKLSHNINNKNGAFYACLLPIFFYLLTFSKPIFTLFQVEFHTSKESNASITHQILLVERLT